MRTFIESRQPQPGPASLLQDPGPRGAARDYVTQRWPGPPLPPRQSGRLEHCRYPSSHPAHRTTGWFSRPPLLAAPRCPQPRRWVCSCGCARIPGREGGLRAQELGRRPPSGLRVLTSPRAGDQDHPPVESQGRGHESSLLRQTHTQAGQLQLALRDTEERVIGGEGMGVTCEFQGRKRTPQSSMCACAGIPWNSGKCSPGCFQGLGEPPQEV